MGSKLFSTPPPTSMYPVMEANVEEAVSNNVFGLLSLLNVAQSSRGAWHLAGTGSLQSALSNATLRRHGFLMPSDLADY